MKHRSRGLAAFTLIELLVVVAIIALLISILLPSLNRAREQTKALVCLSNLRSLGQALIAYDAEAGRLPRTHPSIFRNTNVDYLIDNNFSPDQADHHSQRYLSMILRPFMNTGSEGANSVTDQVATCPVATSRYHSEESFEAYRESKGGITPLPFDYAVNNFNNEAVDSPPPIGKSVRETDPGPYFGASRFEPNPTIEAKFKPLPISVIRRASEEWAVADAWFRIDPSGAPIIAQAGPFQTEDSGNGTVPFAPHFAQRGRYAFSSVQDRDAIVEQIRQAKTGDGRTQTLFFDGHAEPVTSKIFTIGTFEMVYGFPGTVNPGGEHLSEGQLRQLRNGFWK